MAFLRRGVCMIQVDANPVAGLANTLDSCILQENLLPLLKENLEWNKRHHSRYNNLGIGLLFCAAVPAVFSVSPPASLVLIGVAVKVFHLARKHASQISSVLNLISAMSCAAAMRPPQNLAANAMITELLRQNRRNTSWRGLIQKEFRDSGQT